MTKPEIQRYPVEVFWSDEDAGFIAIAPDLPGSSAWGASEVDALREVRVAIEGWIDAARAAGNAIPAPSDRSAPPEYSGKFNVRVPKSLHADLVRCAKADGVSLNSYVAYALTKHTADSGHKVAKQDIFTPGAYVNQSEGCYGVFLPPVDNNWYGRTLGELSVNLRWPATAMEKVGTSLFETKAHAVAAARLIASDVVAPVSAIDDESDLVFMVQNIVPHRYNRRSS